MLVVNEQIQVPLRELRFQFSRSAGPGGQNVNKVNTKATLHWSVTGSSGLPEAVRERFVAKYRRRMTKQGEVVITSQRFRDRGRNVADCLAKLQQMLAAVAVAPAVRKPTRPTRAAKARRRRDKEAQSRKKQLRRRPDSDE
jgi:ribosome-associated protein